MARQHGQIKVNIWVTDDFLDLSPMAQWLFIHLSTHADLSTDHPGDRILVLATKAFTIREVIKG